MDRQLESIEQVRNTLIDLALRFGPRVSVENLSTATFEINQQILEQFRQRGIAVARPQRDVRLVEAKTSA